MFKSSLKSISKFALVAAVVAVSFASLAPSAEAAGGRGRGARVKSAVKIAVPIVRTVLPILLRN